MKKIIIQALKLKLWSELDIQFARMLTRSIFTDDEKYKKHALILASASLSACVQQGHTCLPLHMLHPEKLFHGNYPELADRAYKKSGKLSIQNWKELLFSLSAVSDGSRLSPLVLENKYLYLHHMWKDEHTIAKFFNSNDNSCFLKKEKISEVLDQLFIKNPTKNIDWMKIATAISLIKKKVLISGGPGTGKTFIIAKIVAAFLLLYHNKINIKITAPTGKAAIHVTHSVHSTIHNIMQLNNQHNNVLSEKATTIHTLLGTRLHKNNITQYNHFCNIPIPLDVLIIDEASMVSSSILAQLILALPTHARIIFLGDHHQLCAVESGSAFKDICLNIYPHYSPQHSSILTELTGYILPVVSVRPELLNKYYYNYNNISDSTCILKKNFRFNVNSGIYQLSLAINTGDSTHALSILTSHLYTDIQYIRCTEKKDYIYMITNCALKYCSYLQKIQQQSTSLSIINILTMFNQNRILCVLNNGLFGTNSINYYIEQILHQKGLIKLCESKNYIGRPIIILRNDPALGLSNGDTGILLLNSIEQLSACFIDPKNIVKIIPIHRLPQHVTSFAITIHKAQGSEFKNITIILPDKHMPILTRELLYTAVTRASQNLTLYSTDHVIINSINLITHRYSGLKDKIKQFNLKKSHII